MAVGVRVRARLVPLGLCVALLAGCTAGASARNGDNGDDPGTTPQGPAPVVLVMPPTTATGINPTTPITVSTDGGELASVLVTDTAGAILTGELTADETGWASTGPLAYAQTYVVRATAEGEDGQRTTTQSRFTTIEPQQLVFPSIGPLDGTTVGIAMPVRVYLDAPVTDRAEVQRHLTVTVTPPQEGSWSWLSDTEVHWRPQVYWQAGTQVTVDVNLFGLDFGAGAWGEVDRQISFDVGPAHRSVANAQTHQMQVYDGEQLVRTMPVSMGRTEGGFETRSGAHVVIDKNRNKTMDSTTYGLALDAGGYVTEVEYATRISNNGEFVHSAPWSVADQGVRNVSHGCINLSPQNAAWFFNFAQVGDVVEVVGTSVPLGPADGDIYDWAIPWEQWAAGSALP
ncbi:MAG: Ig-like domain-containing protein [Actinomycetota bacterium]|nr:Ig-like domain-containing protein [Actinomycetota bacterium]